MQQSSNVKYRVWLLDNADNEIFKTVDTEIEVNVELSNLYDKSLASGWNWFSLNKSADDMSLNTILSSLIISGTEGDYIKNQSLYASYYAEYDTWYGTLEDLDNLSLFTATNVDGIIAKEDGNVDL